MPATPGCYHKSESQIMSNLKRKINYFCKKNINSEVVRLIILCVLVLVLGWRHFFSKEVILGDILDVSIIISFLFVAVGEVIAKLIIYVVGKSTEDDTKLRTDYNALIKKYRVDIPKMVKWHDTVFPEVELCSRKLEEPPFRFDFLLEEGRYQLPTQIADHSAELFDAHKYSVVYNNTNIRLNNLEYSDQTGLVKLTCAFTTYFDSLITNRAMDYPFASNRTVREIYEPGPFISNLNESKLSNHLGFNGFVQLADQKIVFVHRGKDVSIGKGTWATSIGASLKTMYALDENKKFTVQGLSNAIRCEIMDELKIELPKETDYSVSIFAFYRDLVEGGKPQFLFYIKTDLLTSKEFEEHFKIVMNQKGAKKNNKKSQIVDGTSFKFLTLDELQRSTLQIDGIVLPGGTKLNMMPSGIGSVALLLKAVN